MSAEIVTIHGREMLDGRTAHAGTVALLEALLEAARSGEIIGVAVATQYVGAAGFERAGAVSDGMIGVLGRLQSRISHILDEAENELR